MTSGLVFVGLGLCGSDSMTVKALDALKSCDKIYAEFYTSFLIDTDIKDLEKTIGKKIDVLHRMQVEETDEIINSAKQMKVGFVTAGDTMSATTHVDLLIQAKEENIPTELFNGITIFSACPTALGLQPYKFGRTVTLPFIDNDYQPQSPYDKILENKERGLHTLVLLDIHADQLRYMSGKEALEWLIKGEEKWNKGLIKDDTLICVASKVGSPKQKLTAGYVKDLMNKDLGEPLFSLVIPGDLHYMEAYSLVYLAGAPESIIEEE